MRKYHKSKINDYSNAIIVQELSLATNDAIAIK